MVKLTEAQWRVLLEMTKRSCGYYTPWVLGTATCEALRKNGLVAPVNRLARENWSFTGRFGYDPTIEITEAGRAALASTDGRGGK